MLGWLEKVNGQLVSTHEEIWAAAADCTTLDLLFHKQGSQPQQREQPPAGPQHDPLDSASTLDVPVAPGSVPTTDLRGSAIPQELSSQEASQLQQRPALSEQTLSILREINLLDYADVLAGAGLCNAEDVVAAGADTLIQLGLKVPHVHRIVNRTRTIVSSTRFKAVPDHAIAGQREVQQKKQQPIAHRHPQQVSSALDSLDRVEEAQLSPRSLATRHVQQSQTGPQPQETLQQAAKRLALQEKGCRVHHPNHGAGAVTSVFSSLASIIVTFDGGLMATYRQKDTDDDGSYAALEVSSVVA